MFASLFSSNQYGSNAYFQNLQASNLGTAAFCNATAFAPASNIPFASASSNGYLLSSDWTRFNSGTGSACNMFASLFSSNQFGSNATFCNLQASNLGTAAFCNVSSFQPASNIPFASASSNGYLLASDWTRFNTAAGSCNMFVSLYSSNQYGSNAYFQNLQASNLGTAAFCNISSFQPTSNLTYAGSNASGFVLNADWLRFSSNCTVQANATNASFSNVTVSNILTMGTSTSPVTTNPALHVYTNQYRGISITNTTNASTAAEIALDNSTTNSGMLAVIGCGTSTNRGMYFNMINNGDFMNVSLNGALYIGRAGNTNTGANIDNDYGTLNITSGGNGNGRGVITWGNSSTTNYNWHLVTGDESGSFVFYNGNYGSGTIRMYLTNGGAMYAGSYNSISSLRYKKNIRRKNETNHNVLKLKPVLYDDINDGLKDCYGIIAEEAYEAGVPEIVTMKKGVPDAVQYDKIGLLLVPIVRELQSTVASLQIELETLRNKIPAN